METKTPPPNQQQAIEQGWMEDPLDRCDYTIIDWALEDIDDPSDHEWCPQYSTLEEYEDVSRISS